MARTQPNSNSHPFDGIPFRLWSVSKNCAERAARDYATADENERIQVAMNLGVAAESLLMATIATIDISLLADGRVHASRLAFTRTFNTTGKFDIPTLKTATWEDAHTLIMGNWSSSNAELGGIKERLRRIMATRNAAVHIGYAEKEDIGASMLEFLKLTEVLHALLPWELSDYWSGKTKDIVDELNDKLTDATRQSKLGKITKARARFASIKEKFGDNLAAYIETCEAKPRDFFWNMDADFQEEEVVECPVCGSDALVYYLGTADDDVPLLDLNPQTDEEYVTVFVWWETMLLDCPVCDLQLSSREAELIEGVERRDSNKVVSEYEPGFETLKERAIRVDPQDLHMHWREN